MSLPEDSTPLQLMAMQGNQPPTASVPAQGQPTGEHPTDEDIHAWMASQGHKPNRPSASGAPTEDPGIAMARTAFFQKQAQDMGQAQVAMAQASQPPDGSSLVEYFVSQGMNVATAAQLASKVGTLAPPSRPLANGVKLPPRPGEAHPGEARLTGGADSGMMAARTGADNYGGADVRAGGLGAMDGSQYQLPGPNDGANKLRGGATNAAFSAAYKNTK